MIRDHSGDETHSAIDESSVKEMFRFLKAISPGPTKSSQQFGKFIVKQVLSGTNQSVVMLAFDPDLQREVVIKIYKPDLSVGQKEMVINEGRSLSQIESNHVARCIAADTIDDCPYLVLEYVPGPTLDQLSLPLISEVALDIVRQITLAMEAVHERGILHLDLKPSNVILTPNGVVKLIDFGLAQPMSNVRFGEVSGTPAFMAPEVANHEVGQIDRRADTFGIGAILYFLLTGKVLYEGDSRESVVNAAKQCQIRDATELVPNRNDRAFRVCAKCLQKNPADRYANVSEVLKEIQTSHRKKWWAAAAASVVIAASALWFSGALAGNSDNVATNNRDASTLNYAAQPKPDILKSTTGNGSSSSQLWYHSTMLSTLMDANTTQTSFDNLKGFALNPRIVRKDSEGREENLRLDQGVVEIHESDLISLHVNPENACHIAAFSIDFTSSNAENGNRGISVLRETESELTSVHAPRHSEATFAELLLQPTPDGKMDYLCIVAREKNLVPSRLVKDAIKLLANNDEQKNTSQPVPDRGIRSLPHKDTFGITIIPYRILPCKN